MKTNIVITLLIAVLSGTALGSDKVLQEQLPIAAPSLTQCKGPKPRVAVYGFRATGKLGAFEGYNVGEGLAAQLATELQGTGCFVVLDRTSLSTVLREQELGLAGVVNSETAPQAGRVIGADVVIKGAVTEYEPNKKGGGFQVGFGLSDKPIGLRLGRNSTTAHVAMDISLIDAETGHVLASHRVQADSKGGGWTLGLDHKRASVGGDMFHKSPFGIASRNALDQAVSKIYAELGNVEWRAQVVKASGNTIYLNAGQNAGLKNGDQYQVSTVVESLIDPETGLLLEKIEMVVGRIEIQEVKENYSVAKMLGQFDTARGDIVHL